LTFTVTTTQPAVRLSFSIIKKSDCSSSSSFNCNNNYPCERVTRDPLPADSYYLRILDTTQNIPPAGNYSFNVSYVYGSSTCRNITDDLDFCKDYLSTDETYKIPDLQTVQNNEADALQDYLTLSLSWSVQNCNKSLIEYACKSNFIPEKCQANGDTVTDDQLLCEQECIDTLASACLQSGEAANLCEKSACKTAANSIGACGSRTPPGDDSGVIGLQLGFIFSVLSILLLRIFN